MKSLLIFCLLISVLLFSCFPDRKWDISVYNNANHSIAFYVGSPLMGRVYPDTTLLDARPPMQQLLPGNYGSWDISYSFEKFFQELPKDTLSIFVFHSDTLSKYDRNVIKSQYKVLKRYDLSLQDLQQKNYTVTYP